MAKSGSFLHYHVETDEVSGLGTSFDTSKFHLHTMNDDDPAASSVAGTTRTRRFQGIVEAITVEFSTIVTAASVTIRLCADEDGDVCLVPDTEADISLGATTSTSGTIVVQVGIPLAAYVNSDQRLWLFAKVDAGSATMVRSCISWRE